MKRLVLLRHAKAVAQTAGLDDRERRLAERGRADAVRMGQFVKEESCAPQLVLCSTALRTRETLDLVLPQLGVVPAVRLMGELYLARWISVVNIIRQVREPADTLMVVGHNPGLEECARKLARPPGDTQARKLHQALNEDFPTAALAVLEFDIPAWSGVERGEGDLQIYVRPKDLRGPG